MRDQRAHRIEGSAAHRLACQDAEPGFHHVQPGGPGWGEVKVHSGMGRQPRPHVRRLVRRRVVEDDMNVCMLAWLPDQLIFGKPRIIDVCIVSGRSVAESRDQHYHNPPDYLVLEPENTIARTRNLQQTNANGYKWQGTSTQFEKAQRIVKGGEQTDENTNQRRSTRLFSDSLLVATLTGWIPTSPK